MGTRSSTRSFTSEIALHLDARGIASYRPRSARQALEHAAYEAHAQVSAPWVSLVAGLPVFFLAGRVLRSRFPYPTASRDGFAVWALYTATDFALVTLSGAIASQGLKGVWGLRASPRSPTVHEGEPSRGSQSGRQVRRHALRGTRTYKRNLPAPDWIRPLLTLGGFLVCCTC